MKHLGGESRAKFFQVDVTDSDSIEAAVEGTIEWVDKTKAPLGGLIPAAGVGIPGLVCDPLVLPPPARAARGSTLEPGPKAE